MEQVPRRCGGFFFGASQFGYSIYICAAIFRPIVDQFVRLALKGHNIPVRDETIPIKPNASYPIFDPNVSTASYITIMYETRAQYKRYRSIIFAQRIESYGVL